MLARKFVEITGHKPVKAIKKIDCTSLKHDFCLWLRFCTCASTGERWLLLAYTAACSTGRHVFAVRTVAAFFFLFDLMNNIVEFPSFVRVVISKNL